MEGLNQHEIVALITIGESVAGLDDVVPTWSIRQDMERAGYTRIAVMLALTTLSRKGMIQYYSYANKDSIGDIYTGYSLREEGMSWLLSNQNMFVLKQEQQPELSDDDIPF